MNRKLLLLALLLVMAATALFVREPSSLASSNGTPDVPSILSDGQFVFGPNVGDFDLEAYLTAAGSGLAPQAPVIEKWCAYASVNPKVVLTLLEMRSGAVTRAAGDSIGEAALDDVAGGSQSAGRPAGDTMGEAALDDVAGGSQSAGRPAGGTMREAVLEDVGGGSQSAGRPAGDTMGEAVLEDVAGGSQSADRPAGDTMREAEFDAEIERLVTDLTQAFYRHLYAAGARRPAGETSQLSAQMTLADGTPVDPPTIDSSGAYAVLQSIASWAPKDDWTRLASPDGVDGFSATYRRLFPDSDPLDTSNDITPDALPPDNLLQFPFPLGVSWRFNGPHNWGGGSGAPYSSIDFMTSANQCSAPPADQWAVASASGSAYRPGGYPCWVRISHGDGWYTSYYHLLNVREAGSIEANDSIGTIGCEVCAGGFADSPHVHFSLLYNGAYVDLEGVKLSGWTVHIGTGYTSGSLERDGITKQPYSWVYNDGVTGVPGTARLFAGIDFGGAVTWQGGTGFSSAPAANSSSFELPDGWSARSWRTDNRTGEMRCWDASAADLVPYAWANAIQSIEVFNRRICPAPACAPAGDQVALYAGRGYTGTCVRFDLGEYPRPADLGALGNDEAESIQIGADVQALVCEHELFDGVCQLFTGDDPYLGDDPIGANIVSSLKVQERGASTPTPTPTPTATTTPTPTPSTPTPTASPTSTPQCVSLIRHIYPTEGGSVDLSPAPNCGAGRYWAGTALRVSAVPSAGFYFAGWTDGAAGRSNPLFFTLTTDRVLTANFARGDAFEPDDSAGQASRLTSGGIQTHSITPATDQDWISLNLLRPSGIGLQVTGVSAEMRLRLYDAAGTLMGESTGESGVSLIRTCDPDALPSGQFYVRVDRPARDIEVPLYTLSFNTEPCGDALSYIPLALAPDPVAE